MSRAPERSAMGALKLGKARLGLGWRTTGNFPKGKRSFHKKVGVLRENFQLSVAEFSHLS